MAVTLARHGIVRRPTLVVLRALGLGDLLTGVPAYRALARAFPRHHRILAAPPALAPLARHVGVFHELVSTAPLAPLDLSVPPTVAVNLHGRGPESSRLLQATAPERLVAFAHPEVPATWDGPPWRPDEHEVLRWCRLLRAHDIPADAADLDLGAPARPIAATAAGATLLHPGAASPARRWPPERFAVVARAERTAGRRVVVTGGPGEEALVAGIVKLAALRPSSGVVCTDGLDLAALVGAAARVVCGDTGVAHLATALRTPSVLLFGPTPPATGGPPADRPWHVVLWAGRAGDPHAPTVDPGLLAIGVSHVQAALARLPDRVPPTGVEAPA